MNSCNTLVSSDFFRPSVSVPYRSENDLVVDTIQVPLHIAELILAYRKPRTLSHDVLEFSKEFPEELRTPSALATHAVPLSLLGGASVAITAGGVAAVAKGALVAINSGSIGGIVAGSAGIAAGGAGIALGGVGICSGIIFAGMLLIFDQSRNISESAADGIAYCENVDDSDWIYLKSKYEP